MVGDVIRLFILCNGSPSNIPYHLPRKRQIFIRDSHNAGLFFFVTTAAGHQQRRADQPWLSGHTRTRAGQNEARLYTGVLAGGQPNNTAQHNTNTHTTHPHTRPPTPTHTPRGACLKWSPCHSTFQPAWSSQLRCNVLAGLPSRTTFQHCLVITT